MALVASFDTVDRVGDIIRVEAFAKSLAAWRQSHKRIPVVWSHQSDDPHLVVGSVDPHDAYESADGLVVKGRLNIHTSAATDHVYDLLKAGDVNSWSFGYQVVRSRRLSDKTTELIELDLGELGPCVTPANTAARTLSVKGLEPSRREPDEPPSHVEVERQIDPGGHHLPAARRRLGERPPGHAARVGVRERRRAREGARAEDEGAG